MPSTPKKSLYEILGVEPTASPQDIKQAYLAIAVKCHPDKTKNDPVATAVFVEAQEAFTVLSDPHLRKRYDRRSALTSFQDLYRNACGSAVMEALLPSAPASPRRGSDAFFHAVVSTTAKTMEAVHPGEDGASHKTQIDLPPHTDQPLWCHVLGLGYPGVNGGVAGDLWVLVDFVDSPKKKTTHPRRKRS